MLTETQTRRYARHVLLPDVGGKGQLRLLAGAVRVDAVDAAAETAILYLAAAGVGTLVVGDAGSVARAGTLFELADVGRPIREAVRERVAMLNPDVTVLGTGEARVALRAFGPRFEEGARAARAAIEELLAP